MGIFDYLKQIFGDSKENREREMSLSDLGEFLRIEYEVRVKALGLQVSIIKERFLEKKEKLRECLMNLENSEIKNKDLLERAKQTMEGNRVIYTKKINSFLKEIGLPDRINELIEFYEDYDKKTEAFNKSISRSQAVMEQFFVKEAGDISRNIIELDRLMKELNRTIEKSGIKSLDKVKKEIELMNEEIKKKDGLCEVIKLDEGKLKEQVENISEIESEIKRLERGKDYVRHLRARREKANLEKEIEDLTGRIISNFSVIEAGLKKYYRMNESDKVAGEYLKDPIKALREDSDLRILEIKEKIKEGIDNGKIELKEKKREKVLLELERFDESYFKEILSKTKEADEKVKELSAMMEEATVIAEIGKLKKELGERKTEVKDKERDIEKMRREVDGFDLNRLKKELEKCIRSSVLGEIRII